MYIATYVYFYDASLMVTKPLSLVSRVFIHKENKAIVKIKCDVCTNPIKMEAYQKIRKKEGAWNACLRVREVAAP